MLNDTTPPLRELLLERLPPPDDRDHVRVVMRLKQREALAVVESAIKIDGLDLGVKAVEDTEELSEDAAGGVAVFETAYRQRVAFVLHTCVECGVGVECGGSTLGFRVIELLSVVFITVVGPQVEVCADLHLLGEQFNDISSEKGVSDSFEPFRLELRPEVIEDRVRRWRVLTGVAERRDRGPLYRFQRCWRGSE